MRILVLGGGIAGLTAAFRLSRAGHDVVCLEPAGRPGGVIWSERRDGFLCETGPQAIVYGPVTTRSLVEDVGLAPRVLPAAPTAKRRFIYRRGRLQPVPMSPPGLLKSGLIGFGGKLRLLAEPFIRKQPREADESLLDFAARRIGRQAAEALVAPAVIGIYAGDASRLSAQSAFPRLVELERKHKSLFGGLMAARKSGTGSGFGGTLSSFPDGLEELPRALAAALGDRYVTARPSAITPAGAGWRVSVDGAGVSAYEGDAVVVAAAPEHAAELVAPLAPTAASVLRDVVRAPVAVACLGFRSADDLGMDLEAYGFLVARGENASILGCQYESSIFPGHRAPEGAVLLRVLLGGVFEPAVLDEPDDAIVARAVADLRTVAGLRRDPDFTAIYRHPRGVPQYRQGHAQKVADADAELARHPQLHVVGHALRGIGINDGIAAATALAARMGGGTGG